MGLLSPICALFALAGMAATPTTQPAHFDASVPKSILILQSFGRDFAPYSHLSARFRTELARTWPGPLIFYEFPLDSAGLSTAQSEATVVRFLVDRAADRPPALIVAVGGPASVFATQNRQQLFPSTPMLIAGSDQRHFRTAAPDARDSVVAVQIDLVALLENILQVVPDTREIMIVLGDSPLEKYWRRQMEVELKPFETRVALSWCDGLSLGEICEKSAHLPPNSAILYGQMLVDAAGVPHEQDAALAALYGSARAPLFGIFEEQLGKGIVGGPLLSVRQTGDQAAQAAQSILSGRSAGGFRGQPIGFSAPIYDWRELQRWGIPENRLPAGSTIRFESPRWWERHAVVLVCVAGVLILQTALIVGFVVQRRRRRVAERDSRSLTGLLLTAHEDERRRLARELHDDLTQRLARLSIDVARLDANGSRDRAAFIRDELIRLTEDVHALSYRLHPSILYDLGLVEALRAECDSFQRIASVAVTIDAGEVTEGLPHEVSLCLYRIAQEALRNVARHSGASSVNLSLRNARGGLELRVSDDGKGFECGKLNTRPSLGHASMRERVQLVRGRLRISSTPGAGSTISAWVPVGGEAS